MLARNNAESGYGTASDPLGEQGERIAEARYIRTARMGRKAAAA